MMRALQCTASCFMATALLACGEPAYPKTAKHALLDRPMPDIKRETLEGAHLDTRALQGRVVVVAFFADDCAPCKRALPAAERVHHAHADVLFLGVSEDPNRDSAKATVRLNGLTFPVVHDVGKQLAGLFRVTALPMAIVADKLGVIRWVGTEGQSEEELLKAVEAAR